MTFKAAFDRSQDWKRRIFLVSMYHNTRKYKLKTWRLADTAKYFDVSIGNISESLMLIEYWTSICDCESRNQALKRLKDGRNMETAQN